MSSLVRRLARAAALGVGVALVSSGPGSGTPSAQKATRQSDTPVVSTVNDAGDVSLGTNSRIQSDMLGDYVSISSRRDTVTSVLQTGNTCCQDWELDLTQSSTRRLLVDLREPVPSNAGATTPFPWAFVPGRIIVKCHVVSPASFPGMQLGEHLNCPLIVRFPTSSGDWRVSLNPIAYAGTDFAQVSCVGADADARCNAWTIASGVTQPDGQAKNIGRLERLGNAATPEDHGDVYLTFSIRVTKP